MTNLKLIKTSAAAIAILLTSNIANAGQYEASLEKTAKGYEVGAEVKDFSFANMNVASMNFGTAFTANQLTDIHFGLAASYDENLTLSLNVDRSSENLDMATEFLISATEFETTYGELNFEFGMSDDAFDGSLSVSSGNFWGLDDANFTIAVSESDEEKKGNFGLKGRTRFGLDLDANVDFDFADHDKNTMSVSVSGSF